MRRILALAALAALAVLAPRPADACTCITRTEDELIAHADAAFEGRALAEETVPPTPACAEPPAPEPRPGCVRLLVWEAQGCAPKPDVGVAIDAREFSREILTTGPDGVAELCGLFPGNYVLTSSYPEIDVHVLAGASASRVVNKAGEWRTRFAVERSLKDDLPDHLWVRYYIDDASCGIARFEIGERYRVLGYGAAPDMIETGLCNGTRRLMTSPDDVDPPQTVAPHRGCAGCSGGGGAGLALGLVALLALRRRAA